MAETDQTPRWNRLLDEARGDASEDTRHEAWNSPSVDAESNLNRESLVAFVHDRLRVERARRRGEVWSWCAAGVALAAAVIVTLAVDWRAALPNDDCPLVDVQLGAEEFLP